MDLRRLFGFGPRRPAPAPPPAAPPSPSPAVTDLRQLGDQPVPWFSNSEGVVDRRVVLVDQAYAVWAELRSEVDRTGRWPLILGDVDSLSLFDDLIADWNGNVDGLVANLPDAETVLRERLEGALMDGDDATVKDDPDLAYGFEPTTLVPADHSGEPEFFTLPGVNRVVIATIPTPDGTLAPAHLGYGGWNDYPEVAEHVAMLRYWRDRHGAEVMGFGSDTVQLRPRVPISDPAIAAALAYEWFAYSSDNVFQGVGSFPELATALLGSPVWFSWWD